MIIHQDYINRLSNEEKLPAHLMEQINRRSRQSSEKKYSKGEQIDMMHQDLWEKIHPHSSKYLREHSHEFEVLDVIPKDLYEKLKEFAKVFPNMSINDVDQDLEKMENFVKSLAAPISFFINRLTLNKNHKLIKFQNVAKKTKRFLEETVAEEDKQINSIHLGIQFNIFKMEYVYKHMKVIGGEKKSCNEQDELINDFKQSFLDQAKKAKYFYINDVLYRIDKKDQCHKALNEFIDFLYSIFDKMKEEIEDKSKEELEEYLKSMKESYDRRIATKDALVSRRDKMETFLQTNLKAIFSED